MFVPFGFTTRRRAGVPSLSGVSDLSREMDRVFAAFAPVARPAPTQPPTPFEDQDDKLVLTMAVPGFGQGDLEITLEQDHLSIRGERPQQPMEGYEPRHLERGKLSFHQHFELPCRVEGDTVHAKLDGGLLRVELIKSGEEAARTIQIHTPENN